MSRARQSEENKALLYREIDEGWSQDRLEVFDECTLPMSGSEQSGPVRERS